jgi:hypothetical protein
MLKPAIQKIPLVWHFPAFRLKPVGAERCYYPGLKPGEMQTGISHQKLRSTSGIQVKQLKHKKIEL